MATNSEVKVLGMEGTEQLVATVKNLLSTKTDVAIDPTLSIEGQAADAKSVGDAIKAMNHIVATDDGNGIITLSISPLAPADKEEF